MKIEVSTHNHTLVSQHAYSTFTEYMQRCNEIGLRGFVLTDHTLSLGDGAHPWHFINQRVLPEKVGNVRFFKGAEVNVLDTEGSVDLENGIMKNLDFVICSMHEPCYKSTSFKNHTKTWLNIAKNPYIDAIGHSGQDIFKYDYETAVKEFKKYNKIVEINSHSFSHRKGAKNNCREIALMCKKYGVRISVGADAHSIYQVDDFSDAVNMLEEIDFPKELIINLTLESFLSYVEERKNRVK